MKAPSVGGKLAAQCCWKKLSFASFLKGVTNAFPKQVNISMDVREGRLALWVLPYLALGAQTESHL